MSTYIKISQAAKILNVSLRHTRTLILAGRLSGRMVVRGYREVWEVDIQSIASCAATIKYRAKNSVTAKKSKPNKIFALNGYVMISTPSHPNARCDGYVYEHTLVAEKMLGRYLVKGEVVDHINSIRFDNRPENLAVYPSQREHKKAEYYKPLINRGGDPELSKLCTGCDVIQPKSHFRPYSHYVDGLELYCQECRVKAKHEDVLPHN